MLTKCPVENRHTIKSNEKLKAKNLVNPSFKPCSLIQAYLNTLILMQKGQISQALTTSLCLKAKIKKSLVFELFLKIGSLLKTAK